MSRLLFIVEIICILFLSDKSITREGDTKTIPTGKNITVHIHSKESTNTMSDQYENKDLGEKGSENTIKGKVKDAAGKVQEAIGKATDNPKTEAKGDAKQVEGKTQSTVGHTERKIDNTLNPDK
jgi:uncharacterized protein YjbJ (UPF0337 family)